MGAGVLPLWAVTAVAVGAVATTISVIFRFLDGRVSVPLILVGMALSALVLSGLMWALSQAFGWQVGTPPRPPAEGGAFNPWVTALLVAAAGACVVGLNYGYAIAFNSGGPVALVHGVMLTAQVGLALLLGWLLFTETLTIIQLAGLGLGVLGIVLMLRG